MKAIKLVRTFIILTLVHSCSMISLQNISNDKKWKKERFSIPLTMKFEYSPRMITSYSPTYSQYFYKVKHEDVEEKFTLKKNLIDKFRKRNIELTHKGKYTLRIDSLLFKEYFDNVAVFGNENSGYIGNFEKNYFVFRVYASLIDKKGNAHSVTVVKTHNTEPRESYLIPGAIVDDGAGAFSDKMIENKINEFSYMVYKKVKELENGKELEKGKLPSTRKKHHVDW